VIVETGVPGSIPRIIVSSNPVLNVSALPNLQIIQASELLGRIPKYVHVDAGSRAINVAPNGE
jgi:hypothetical protein